MNNNKNQVIAIKPEEYVEQQPYINDVGIYVPIHRYAPKGTESISRCIMTKEMFVEAYNKWIRGEE